MLTMCAWLQGARRQQLVMADRAFGLVNLLENQGLRPDAAMWNALMECAGFSGQLTRAFGVLQDMTSAGCRPGARTFVALISACNGVRLPLRSGRGRAGTRLHRQHAPAQSIAMAFAVSQSFHPWRHCTQAHLR